MSNSANLRYTIITPARNEEDYIEKTIQSVVSQKVLPVKYVIVSDGSTDRTEEIVEKYLPDNPWLELVRKSGQRTRQFGAKVHCFNTGFEKLSGVDYDVVGNLDADISFEPDYFEFLMEKFAADPKLGVAGTPFVERDSHYDYRFTNIQHVSGACQMFRAECFEEIGRYTPIPGGGIDWVAVTTARMKGWNTRTFTERTCLHHRPMGTGTSGSLKAILRAGKKDYFLGGGLLWQCFRALFQMTRRPYILIGTLLFAGYLWGLVTRCERPISDELMKFHRGEQNRRLRQFFASRIPGLRRRAVL